MAISYYHIIDRKECDLRKYYSIWLCIISKDITKKLKRLEEEDEDKPKKQDKSYYR